jgi:hypothetical protein
MVNKEKFWKFMDSAKGFWTLIFTMIITGIFYMIGASKTIDKIMEKRKEGK